jgi:hypothetical protein
MRFGWAMTRAIYAGYLVNSEQFFHVFVGHVFTLISTLHMLHFPQ